MTDKRDNLAVLDLAEVNPGVKAVNSELTPLHAKSNKLRSQIKRAQLATDSMGLAEFRELEADFVILWKMIDGKHAIREQLAKAWAIHSIHGENAEWALARTNGKTSRKKTVTHEQQHKGPSVTALMWDYVFPAGLSREAARAAFMAEFKKRRAKANQPKATRKGGNVRRSIGDDTRKRYLRAWNSKKFSKFPMEHRNPKVSKAIGISPRQGDNIRGALGLGKKRKPKLKPD